jgi:hypothetical protein
MKHDCIIAGGALRRTACFRFPKSLAEFRRRAAKENSIIFSGDMCVGENTFQAASVEFVRRWHTNYARSRLQTFCRKTTWVFRQATGGAIRRTACLHFRACVLH